MRPILVAIAPVKAPFSWPKSSDSRSCSGSAAQLIATNGLPERGEPWWTSREMTSLPVPDSPVGLGRDAGLLGELLMGQRERDAVGETPRHLGVRACVTGGLAVEEAEPAADLSGQPHGNPEPGAHPGGPDETIALGRGLNLGWDVAEDLELLGPAHQLPLGQSDRLGRRRNVRLPGGCHDADRAGSRVQLGQHHQVMGKHGPDRF